MSRGSRSTASPMDWNRNCSITSPTLCLKKNPDIAGDDNTISKMQISDIILNNQINQKPLKDSNYDHPQKDTKHFSKFYSTCATFFNVRNISIFPYIIIGYLRLLFHLAWFISLLWCIWSLYDVLINDINIKINNETNLILKEIQKAKDLYFENRCYKEDVIKNSPALASLCAEWKTIADQKDPRSKISHGRLTAETFAEILNSFVEKISFRSMIFTIATAMVIVILSRTFLGLISTNPQLAQYPRCIHDSCANIQRSNYAIPSSSYTHGNYLGASLSTAPLQSEAGEFSILS